MTGKEELLLQERSLVVPGDIIANGLEFLPGSGCYRENSEVKSKLLGFVRLRDKFVSVVPISGVYMPRSGDGIIAVVDDMQSTFWILDINSPYDAILQLGEAVSEFVDISKTDISVYFDIGDVIYAKVLNANRGRSVTLTMNDRRARKLTGGRLMNITPSKVPRLIGREGSMIELIKKKTGCQIIVGQNGRVWLRGENENLAAKAVIAVEKEAHTEGLTDRITKLLGGEL